MATLYLFVGHPGSGKTTAANLICKLTGAEHLWADQERHKMFGRPTHSAEESRQLYASLNQRTAELLRSGKSVVFDTNFNYRQDRRHLHAIADEAGAKTVVIEMTTPVELARDRALAGSHAEKNGMDEAMSQATFERIVHHREHFETNETSVLLSGEDLSEASVRQALNLP
jgi:predicted kinase